MAAKPKDKKDDKLESFLLERKESGDYCAKVH